MSPRGPLSPVENHRTRVLVEKAGSLAEWPGPHPHTIQLVFLRDRFVVFKVPQVILNV